MTIEKFKKNFLVVSDSLGSFNEVSEYNHEEEKAEWHLFSS